MPTPRKSTLGDLSWITASTPPKRDSHDDQVSQDSKPRPDILNRLIAKPRQPDSDAPPNPVISPSEASQDEPESPLNVDIPASLHSRLHSVVAWDEEHRTLKEIVAFILAEGLAKFPDKGPAPPRYLARLKSYGKRKTPKS